MLMINLGEAGTHFPAAGTGTGYYNNWFFGFNVGVGAITIIAYNGIQISYSCGDGGTKSNAHFVCFDKENITENKENISFQ